MGLTSHLEGIMNGMLLMLLGLHWPRLVLGARAGLVVTAAAASDAVPANAAAFGEPRGS